VTYLELINKVLNRLRQDTIASLSDNGATIVGHFVNQAKEEIEDMGPWKALRSAQTVSASAGTASYAMGSTNERSYVLRDPRGVPQIYETTSGSKGLIDLIDWEEMRRLHNLDESVVTGQPIYAAIDRSASGLTIKFYPTPASSRTYSVVCVVPQAALAAVDTALTIPSRPVWMYAAALYALERGEEGSGEPGSLMMQARAVINDAVLTDFGADNQTFYAD
jgi:hypothetical protein